MVNFYKSFVRCDGQNATIQDVIGKLNYIFIKVKIIVRVLRFTYRTY